MKIAIVGAGVAGSYLGCILHKNGYDVEVFESSRKKDHWAVCAWAAPKHLLSFFSSKADLNFDDYILYTGRTARVIRADKTEGTYDFSGMITYDKNKWESDLLRNVNVSYGERCTRNTFQFEKYDFVIDCTGVNRELLPRVAGDFLIPSYEYLVEGVWDINYFYFVDYAGAKGYFWYFPLNNGRGYVGAGDYDRKYLGLKEFFQQHPEAKILKKIGRPIRLSPPAMMKPFYDRNVIGVGESIGCVFPITGEGIVPSLICCTIFLKILNINGSNAFDFKLYESMVLRVFALYYDAYRILKLLLYGNVNHVMDRLIDLKKLVINNADTAEAVEIAADILELISFVNNNADNFVYPIGSYVELAEKMQDYKFSRSKVLKILNTSIPTSHFPIIDKRDLQDSLNMMAEQFIDILVLGSRIK